MKLGISRLAKYGAGLYPSDSCKNPKFKSDVLKTKAGCSPSPQPPIAKTLPPTFQT